MLLYGCLALDSVSYRLEPMFSLIACKVREAIVCLDYSHFFLLKKRNVAAIIAVANMITIK